MFRSPLFTDLVTLRNDVERLASQAMTAETPTRRTLSSRAWVASVPVDVYSTSDHAVVIAALPGLSPDDVEISVHQNTVTISGALRNVAESDDAKDATWYVSELSSGDFRRSITLPFHVDADRTTAWSENGILRITLPKVESAKARKITVSSERSDALEASNPAA